LTHFVPWCLEIVNTHTDIAASVLYYYRGNLCFVSWTNRNLSAQSKYRVKRTNSTNNYWNREILLRVDRVDNGQL